MDSRKEKNISNDLNNLESKEGAQNKSDFISKETGQDGLETLKASDELIEHVEGSLKKEKASKAKGGFKKLPRYARVLIITAAALLVLAGAFAGWFYWKIGRANQIMNSVTSSEIENILAPVESIEEPVCILLLGRDTRDAEEDLGRTDTIMLLYLDPVNNKCTLLSIPRDTYVDIPGYKKDKINAAYAYGGEKLMIETVSNFLNAKINHFVTIDFDGFVKLIDALGGVDVTIDRPLTDPKSGANFSAGQHHLTGEQALAFTRSRSTELADIGRIQRQQILFTELVSQKFSLQYLSKIPDYFNILIENTKTDLDLLTILRYAKSGLDLGIDNFKTAIVPTHADWIEDNTISVQIPDIEESRSMWSRILLGEPASKYSAIYTIEGENIPDAVATDAQYSVRVKVKNTGALEWEGTGSNPVYLSYHWLNFETKEIDVFDGRRSILPQPKLSPGQEVIFDLKISSPPEKGKYILQIDLVHEGLTWFSYQGVPPLEKFCTLDISYSAQYNDNKTTPLYLEPGQEFEAEVALKNTGYMIWQYDGQIGRVDLGIHWINRDTGEVVIWDGPRGLLLKDLDYGEEAVVTIVGNAPDKKGRYILQYDMVHEGYSWFSDQGVIPLEININVGQTIDKALVKKTTVKVFNGNGNSGSATDFVEKLLQYEFKVSSPSNAKSFDFNKTKIIYKSSSKLKAEQLALILGSYELIAYSSEWVDYRTTEDLAVILGSDYEENLE